MEFPIYRKTHTEAITFIKMVGQEHSICVTVFNNGDGNIEVDTTTEARHAMRHFSCESTSSEFTAALEEVQKKIKEAVTTTNL